jgi:HEAT repeat protein
VEYERNDAVRTALLAQFAFAPEQEPAAATVFALANQPDSPDDPAYDAYREARRQLNRARYQRASRLLMEIQGDYPRSVYADDALYWAAFARYQLADRDDDRGDFEQALEILDELRDAYSSSDVMADANELTARIRARLAELGDARSAARVRESADQDPDDEIRLYALDALLHMNSDDAVPILQRLLIENRESNSPDMRAKAVFILSQNSSDETTDILLQVARNDPDREVRLQAVFWLSQVDDQRAVDALVEVLASSDDEELQEKAIFALSQHESENAALALRDYATDPSKPNEVRENAIFWLGQQGSGSNFEFLTELYTELESSQLKEKVIFAVSQHESRRSREWLMSRVHDTNESVEMRKQALFWIGQQGEIPCSDLGQLVNEFEDQEILEQLVFVLGQRREDDCVDALIEISRSTKDLELRKNAVFWLGQTRHPRALRYLEELIGQ